MSAIWPSSVASALNLLTAVNNTKVTLNVNAGVGDTTLTVDDASPLPASGYVTFNDNETSPETVYYTGISGGNTLTGVTRGADNTAAATHVVGAGLEQRWNASYHNTLAAEIVAIETDLAARFGDGASSNAIVVPSGVSFTLKNTTNQIVLGTTHTTTISATAPASSITLTIPDTGGAASFVMTAGTQTIAGATTFSATLTMSSATIAMGGNKITGLAAGTASGDALRYEQLFGTNGITLNGNLAFTTTSTQGIVGTIAVDNAAVGNVGEYVVSIVPQGSAISAGTSGQFKNITSITLSAGDWDVCGNGMVTLAASAVFTNENRVSISLNSGNTTTSDVNGYNIIDFDPPISNLTDSGACIPLYRVSINTSTVVYLKLATNYTSGPPIIYGTISARRRR